MDEGEGGDQMDQFHRNEAISAVADEGFLGEEDDDYEDLYNDVNVGEGFFQSLKKNGELGYRNDEEEKPGNSNEKIDSTAGAAPPVGVSMPGVGSASVAGGDVGVGPVGASDGYDGQGCRGVEMSGKAPRGPGSDPRFELGQAANRANDMEAQSGINSAGSAQGLLQQPHGVVKNESLMKQGGGHVNGIGGGVGNMVGNVGASGVGGPGISGGAGAAAGTGSGTGGGNGTILFVGDLHWWTTDAELEAELSKYGPVKEVKFFDEKASGKSKGYCQVEFYDSNAAAACKEGMNGHVFNGRPCVVAFASPYTVKRMGEAQVNRNQQMAQAALAQARRGGATDAPSKPAGGSIATGGNFQTGDGSRGFPRGNWGRGNGQGMGNRGPMGPMRGRAGGVGGRGMMGNGGNGFGQGMGGNPPLMHPQSVMGQGFDPAFGGPMGRMSGFGGFPGGPAPPFPGMLSSFPHVGGVGLPGVAPHLNPAFFGRGMPMNGMGMMPAGGVGGGSNMGMWSDPNMGGWGSEEQGGGRAAESSYGEEAASDHQYGEGSHDRGGWQNPAKEKDRISERAWSGSSERRHRDDRERGYERNMPKEKELSHDRDWSERRHRDDRAVGRERERSRDRDRERSRERDRDKDRERDRDRGRDRHREGRERYSDHHRHRDHETEHDDEWDRGRSSRNHSKSRLLQEDDHRSRSRDADYGKRRRLTSDLKDR